MSLDKIIELTYTLSRVEENLKEEMSILSYVLDSITDGYWDWNIQTDYEFFSERFKSQLGYKRMTPSPTSWQNICHPDDLEVAKKALSEHFSGKASEFSQILRFTHKKGHEVVIKCSGKVVSYDDSGNPLRMVGTHILIPNE
jgi:PAS domain S-box-containing protein